MTPRGVRALHLRRGGAHLGGRAVPGRRRPAPVPAHLLKVVRPRRVAGISPHISPYVSLYLVAWPRGGSTTCPTRLISPYLPTSLPQSRVRSATCPTRANCTTRCSRREITRDRPRLSEIARRDAQGGETRRPRARAAAGAAMGGGCVGRCRTRCRRTRAAPRSDSPSRRWEGLGEAGGVELTRDSREIGRESRRWKGSARRGCASRRVGR